MIIIGREFAVTGSAFDRGCGWRGDLGVEDGKIQDAGPGIDRSAPYCLERRRQTTSGKLRPTLSGD